MTDEPMIWTTKGNIPCSSLDYETKWVDAPDFVQFIERYLLAGEVVRESCHVYNRSGLVMGAHAAS